MYKRGQVSLEFMSYYIILTILFLAVIAMILFNQKAISNEKTLIDARNVLILAKNEIDVAMSVGDGYSNKFFLPQVLHGGIEYNISIFSPFQTVNIIYNNNNISLPILTDNITSNIHRGNNIIKNTGGMIDFE